MKTAKLTKAEWDKIFLGQPNALYEVGIYPPPTQRMAVNVHLVPSLVDFIKLQPRSWLTELIREAVKQEMEKCEGFKEAVDRTLKAIESGDITKAKMQKHLDSRGATYSKGSKDSDRW